MSAAFRKPPINEVIVSSYFTPPLADFRSEHVGLFWEKIKTEFPMVRQQFPVNIGQDIFADEFFPMPRYWFIASDEISLIQIQKNAFMFNWRRRKANEYPRYFENIKPAFDKYYSLFSEFVRTELGRGELPIDLCELVYINTIEHCDFWKGPQDTTNVIPSFALLESGIDAYDSLGFNCNYSYRVSTDLQINIALRSGVKVQQQNAPVLAFEIKASGRLGGKTKTVADDWFNRAHNAVNKCFMHLTSTRIQKEYWHPQEERQ